MNKNEININWMRFLKEVTSKSIAKKRKASHERLFRQRDSFIEVIPKKYHRNKVLESTLKELNYACSDSFFTSSTQRELYTILHKKDICSMSRDELIETQKELDLLNLDEYEWKLRVTGHNSDHRALLELFADSFEKFKPMLKTFFSPESGELLKSQRGYMRFFEYKLEHFLGGMLDLLIKESHLVNLKVIKERLTKEDLRVIIKNHLSEKTIFIDLVKVIMKKAHDNLFTNEHKGMKHTAILTENSFVVEKTAVFYEFRRVFALNVLTSVLCYAVEQKIDETLDVASTSEKIRNFLYREKHKYDREDHIWWTNHLTSSVFIIIDYIEQSDFFFNIVKEKPDQRNPKLDRIIFILPTKVEPLIISFTGLPRILKPDNLDPNELDENLIQVVFGENRISKSSSLARVLTIAQRKAFGVNTSFLDLLIEFMDPKEGSIAEIMTSSKSIEIPFQTPLQKILLDDEVDDFSKFSTVCSFNKIFAEEIHTRLVGVGVKNVSYTHLLNVAGVTILEQNLAKGADIARYRRQKCLMQRKAAQTHIFLGKAYTGIPIYITNTYCVRLRLYPKQPFISRTSGIFKHILCEYTPLKITLQGMVSLMRCFFVGAGQHENLFEEFLLGKTLSKKTGMATLKKFFTDNPINFYDLKDNFLYVCLLYMEILKVQETGKTSVMVEIDQKASGSVFLSLALRNKKMAKFSNIISQEKRCPYTYCMEMFPQFYEEFMENRDEQAFRFLSTNRKLHKYAKMCFSYSQKGIGRSEDFIERWFLEEGDLSPSARKVLIEFAYRYDSFIEYVYPGITAQIKNLLELVSFVTSESGETTINNLNGEKLKWRRFKNKSITRKAFNPVTKEQITYRLDTLDIVSGMEQIDVSDHKRKFLSYLIHSIDAAVMHYFIVRMRDKYKYTINHLHDCVLIHPNHVEGFYDIVNELYSSRKLYDILETSVFEPAEHSVSEESVEFVKSKKKIFEKLSDDFADELKNHSPKNLYQPEH
jgi:hypothetical protein